MNNPVYKLLDWIDINKLYWDGLSRNPNAINLLKNNLDKVRLTWLLENPNVLDIIDLIDAALLEKCLNRFSKSGSNRLFRNINVIKLLKNYPDKIDWCSLSSNPDAIQLLKTKYPDKIDWNCLSLNINIEAIELLKQNPKKIDWRQLSLNPNSEALKLLKENPKKISWRILSDNSNPEAIDLLKTYPVHKTLVYDDLAMNVSDRAIELLIENIDKLTDLGWHALSYNTNSKAIQLLKNNLDKIDDECRDLSYNKNPDMMDLLKENQHLIFWNEISDNPNIFQLDYEQMKKNFEPLAKEIIEVSCHPERIGRLMKQYNLDFEDWFN